MGEQSRLSLDFNAELAMESSVRMEAGTRLAVGPSARFIAHQPRVAAGV